MNGERRLPKVQLSTRSGIEPGTFWLVVSGLTNYANLAHTGVGHVAQCLSLLFLLNKTNNPFRE